MKRPWDAVVWWEIRRIPYNLAILVVGVFSGTIIAFAGGRMLGQDADFGHPFIGMILYGLLANLCYTLGWITELLWSWGDTALTEKTRPKVFRAGLIFSAILTLLPTILLPRIWTGRRGR